MTTIIAFVFGAAVTYGLRASMVLGGDRVVRAPRLQAALGFVTPAVLTAMVASALLLRHQQLAAPHLAEILAIAGAFAAARRTGNVSMALAVGLPLYWIGAALGLS